jgi:RNA polymerase sigma factor (sigma-70 family)
VPQSSDPEFLNRIEQAMLSLPSKTREIFIAHRVHGLSYQQIADRTGISVRRVKRHMVRALCQIDRTLEGEPLRWWERLFGR